jgi:hypothetical protein
VVQAVVSETDITNTQTKINKIKQGSELWQVTKHL